MNTVQQPEPLVVPAGTGPFVELGDHRGHITVSAQSTDGAFLLVDTQVDPDGGVPPHLHRREDETFSILEGRFAPEVGGQSTLAGPGDTVFAPRGLAHSWRCVSPEGGRFLILITPGDNFEAFALAMAQRSFIPAAAMAEADSAAAFMALAARYGIGMLPPVK